MQQTLYFARYACVLSGCPVSQDNNDNQNTASYLIRQAGDKKSPGTEICFQLPLVTTDQWLVSLFYHTWLLLTRLKQLFLQD